MTYYAREINRPKWEGNKPWLVPGAIRADAVTGSLRTDQDELSVWECQDNKGDVAEIVLAVASVHKRLESVHLVLLDEDELKADGVELKRTRGKIKVEDLKLRHANLVRLDLVKLSAIATRVATQVCADARCYEFTTGEVLAIVREAIGKGRVNKEDLQPAIANAL